MKRLNVCINNFISKCLTGEAKNTIKLILVCDSQYFKINFKSIIFFQYGVTKANRAYCSSTSRKTSFYRFGKCINRNLKELTQVTVDLNRQLHGILQYSDPKMRIPMICCAYTTFKPASLETLKGCSEDEVTGFEHLIDSYAADGLSLVCSGYTAEESDVCNSVLKKIPKWNKPFIRKAFFYTIVDILNSL